ncbi:MAG: hypothetical protein ACHQAX_09230 [Gammaproteobacteria bacterium]
MSNHDVNDLIIKSYSEKVALKHRSFVPTLAQLNEIKETALVVLEKFPNRPFSCAPMSALLAKIIRDNTPMSAHVVAGDLDLHGRRVFGDGKGHAELSKRFNTSTIDWDGHCWVSFGNYICDISFLRTAYATNPSHWLHQQVKNTFESKELFLLFKPRSPSHTGLIYHPRYVLTDDQVCGLMNGARVIIQEGGQ